MSTGAVAAGALVDGGGVVGAVVAGGTLVGGGGRVVVVVVVVVVVGLTISGGNPSASIGVTPSLVGRLQAASAAESTRATHTRRAVGRGIMQPPLAVARRSGRRLPGGPRPMPRHRARWRARPPRQAPIRCRSGGGRRCRG